MAKLVIVTQGMTGSHELNVDRITIGRVEDNTFQIADPSVSSHHCEVHLRGDEVFIRDLNSTNGSFVNGDKVTEGALKPGQMLRLGNVELRLEGAGQTAASAKKQIETTMVIPRGISLDQLEQGGRVPAFESGSTVFTKKTNRGNKFFWIAAVFVGAVIVGLIIYVLSLANSSHK